MTAVYGPPSLTRVVTVNSSNPNGAVSMLVSPADRSGLGNGMTGFTRTLTTGQLQHSPRPSTAGGNVFLKWQKDGLDAGRPRR